MASFKKDLSILIEEGMFAANNEKIRFIFKRSDLLKGDIGYLDLSTRSYNALKRAGANTIEDITERWDSLDKMRGAGKNIVKEIKNKYIEYYYNQLDNPSMAEFWLDTIQATKGM